MSDERGGPRPHGQCRRDSALGRNAPASAAVRRAASSSSSSCRRVSSCRSAASPGAGRENSRHRWRSSPLAAGRSARSGNGPPGCASARRHATRRACGRPPPHLGCRIQRSWCHSNSGPAGARPSSSLSTSVQPISGRAPVRPAPLRGGRGLPSRCPVRGRWQPRPRAGVEIVGDPRPGRPVVHRPRCTHGCHGVAGRRVRERHRHVGPGEPPGRYEEHAQLQPPQRPGPVRTVTWRSSCSDHDFGLKLVVSRRVDPGAVGNTGHSRAARRARSSPRSAGWRRDGDPPLRPVRSR